jgi:DMSO/TMAO reductase YedYZ molybdopterin-dependent catalytic subunit
VGRVSDDARDPVPRAIPPGQRPTPAPRVQHYGPVPRFKPQTWSLTVTGATADGQEHRFDVGAFAELPRVCVVGDMHCVTKWSVLDNAWEGVATATLLALVPPAGDVTHVMAWAEFGYSANMRLTDFAAADAVLATHRNSALLTPEHGYPLRLVIPHLYAWKGPKWLRAVEYMVGERRGFWEERGYHTNGDPWYEERYSYQE